MKCAFILAGVLLLVAISTVSADHDHHSNHGKAAGGVSHTDSGEQKVHHTKKVGKKFNHDHEKANKGKSEVVVHKKEDVEKGGKKHHEASEGGHHSQHHEQGHGGHGANYKHGDKKKKTNFEKGFREQYHKDEHKKSDSWFSNKHKSGEWLKYGVGNTKHHAFKHDKDSHGKFQNAKHQDKHGKETKYANGHAKADHKAHKSQHGGETHYVKHDEYAKKKNHGHGKQ